MANKKGTAARVAANVQQFHNPAPVGTFEKHKPTDMVTVGVRISPVDRKRLQGYFEARGLRLGQGLRMILKDWLETNRV